MAQLNSTIMAGLWLEGTNDFQQRIPDPTQAGIAATVNALFDPMNKQYYNQFLDGLVNRIGATYVHATRWDNPLAAFKGGKLMYGSTIQEIAPKWIKAHSYMDDSELLLKMERPEVRAAYHSLNREDRYDITITREELRQAFVDEYGLNNLIASAMTVPQNSDSYDEYLIMKQLIAEYENEWGFFKMHLSNMPTDEATGKEFLSLVRTLVGKLQFPSTLYNSLAITDIPVFAKQDELILLTTPEVMGSLSVDVLSSIFHVENADINVRQVMIDEFPIPNAVAILTTRDWFVCNDVVYDTASFYNPETLSTKYYLHHWGVYSASPFVPAILFTTDAGTDVNSIVNDGGPIDSMYIVRSVDAPNVDFEYEEGRWEANIGSLLPKNDTVVETAISMLESIKHKVNEDGIYVTFDNSIEPQSVEEAFENGIVPKTTAARIMLDSVSIVFLNGDLMNFFNYDVDCPVGMYVDRNGKFHYNKASMKKVLKDAIEASWAGYADVVPSPAITNTHYIGGIVIKGTVYGTYINPSDETPITVSSAFPLVIEMTTA